MDLTKLKKKAPFVKKEIETPYQEFGSGKPVDSLLTPQYSMDIPYCFGLVH